MVRDVSIEEALKLKDAVFVDVRSQDEFNEATIPGAVNIPLFDNNERAIVGRLYKEQGPREAKMKGLEIAGPKLPEMIAGYLELKNRFQNIVVFCWRGGMRSRSIAAILDLMDLPAYRVTGGYKAYRKLVNDFFARPKPDQQVVVLRGLTGVGKTEILKGMARDGMPVIDLEGLAHNRGSVFGAVGMESPPSQKMFDALLMQKLIEFADSKYIVVECESKKVGRLFVPEVIMTGMREGLQILIYDDLENRVRRIVEEYTDEAGQNTGQLQKAIGCLEGTLGKKRVAELAEMVEMRQYDEVVRFLLINYYDPLYKYPDHPTEDFDFAVKSDNIEQAIQKIREYLESYYRS